MNTANPNTRILRPTEFDIIDEKRRDTKTQYETNSVENAFEPKETDAIFSISIILPIVQIMVVSIALMYVNSSNNLYLLLCTIVGVFTIGLISDITGTIIASKGRSKLGGERCLIPLILNFVLLVPRAIILLGIMGVR